MIFQYPTIACSRLITTTSRTKSALTAIYQQDCSKGRVLKGSYAGTNVGCIRHVKVGTLLVIMTMDSRDVLNAISFCNGMGLDVLVVIMSCGPNHITTNQRGECSKQFSEFDPFIVLCLSSSWWSFANRNKTLLNTLFELFQSSQRSYSWMKYYNNEIDARNKLGTMDDNIFKELLQDVTKHINGSLALLALQPKQNWQ